MLAAYAGQGYLTVARAADRAGRRGGRPRRGHRREPWLCPHWSSQFSRAGPVVLGAADGVAGDLVDRVRHDPQLSHTVSTVDNIGTGTRVSWSLVWALANQLAGRVGAFGDGAGRRRCRRCCRAAAGPVAPLAWLTPSPGTSGRVAVGLRRAVSRTARPAAAGGPCAAR